MPPGQEGAIAIKLPLPPGGLVSVWGDDTRFRRSYLEAFPGYYSTGDGGYFDDDGYLFVLGRTDDVMNVAGHRLSSGQIEAMVAEHPGVAECAVIGVAHQLKGQVPWALVVPTTTYVTRDAELIREVSHLVRERVGPIASLAAVDIVPALPKTRSGKIIRRSLRQIAEGAEPDVPSTIDNPASLEEIRRLVQPLPQPT